MKELFTVSVTVDKPIVVGQDSINGRRQLIPITGGSVVGNDLDGNALKGIVLAGGVDSQIIRPNGRCDLSARYACQLEDGRSFYIENNGMRTVPEEYVQDVLQGKFIDPSLYYFVTTPILETYDQSLKWMENKVLICKAKREPDSVKIIYYVVE